VRNHEKILNRLEVKEGESQQGNINIIHLLSITYSDKKEKTTNNFHRLSPCVDFSYKLSNKFIEDFERIMDLVEHKHSAL